MMDSWRRQRGGNHKQEVQRTRSNNRKPPMGSWQATVPSWEKKFCSLVGAISWRKILEAKKFMYLYDNVVKWNDSAGEEAFHNAKNRFWAKINGLPCDLPFPDPDIYIDEIDWNPNIDPELVLDLEREPIDPDEGEKDEKEVIIGNSLLLNQFPPCTGWGDAEEDQAEVTKSHGPGLADSDRNLENYDNPWEPSCDQGSGTVKETGWGNCGNNLLGWNQWEHNIYDPQSFDCRGTDGVWGMWDGDTRNREGADWSMSRYKTSRFPSNEYQADRGWGNGRGRKRVNFVYERPYMDKKPASRQWNMMNSCQPLNHGSGKAQDPWSWEKPVS